MVYGGLQDENKMNKKCKKKKEPLEVSGCWIRVLKFTEGSPGLFPRVGENDL